MRLRDMKYIGFKHQRENKQNSDNIIYVKIETRGLVSSVEKIH
jgi:hypothetical protein